MLKPRVLVATSNPGKLRDFAAAAEVHGITIAAVPNFSSLLQVVEDGATFEANARKKAEAYSLAAPRELVLADDSGLEVDALGGAPGVHSARYADEKLHLVDRNADGANNARLLRELKDVPVEKRGPRWKHGRYIPWRGRRNHVGRASRRRWLWVRSAVLSSEYREDLCGTNWG